MRLLERKSIFRGWSSFFDLEILLDDGRPARRQLEDHGEAAAVLAYDPTRRMALLARQQRIGPLAQGFSPWLVEAAAGIIDAGETPEAAAMRETREELGVRVTMLEPIVSAWSIPSLSTERVHLFLAPYGEHDRIWEGGGMKDEGEYIEVLETPLKSLVEEADAGRLTDMKTLILVWALARRRPELFI